MDDTTSNGAITPSYDDSPPMEEDSSPAPETHVYPSSFTSTIFEIIAGRSSKRFFVHSALLMKSEPLRKIIEGDWKDSCEKKILWDMWEEDTVARFVEWLYTGEYSPKQAKNKDAKDTVVDPQEKSAREILENMEKAEVEERLRPRLVFDPPSYTSEIGLILSMLEGNCSKPENNDQLCEEDCSGAFVIHAKLAVLAEYTDIPELRSLALKRLLHALLNSAERLEKGSSAVKNLVALIRYVYANTQDYVSKEDLLRKIVSIYAGVHLLKLRGTEVRELLLEGGEFVVDFMFETMRHAAILVEECRNERGLREACDDDILRLSSENDILKGKHNDLRVENENLLSERDSLLEERDSLRSERNIWRKKKKGSWGGAAAHASGYIDDGLQKSCT